MLLFNNTYLYEIFHRNSMGIWFLSLLDLLRNMTQNWTGHCGYCRGRIACLLALNDFTDNYMYVYSLQKHILAIPLGSIKSALFESCLVISKYFSFLKYLLKLSAACHLSHSFLTTPCSCTFHVWKRNNPTLGRT